MTRRLPRNTIHAALVCMLVLAGAAALLIGAGELSDSGLVRTYLRLRAARFGAAFVAGAGLAVAGVIVQGVFRNPLASPSVIGTTAGASLGGRLVLLASPLAFGGVGAVVPPELLLPIGCIVGAVLSLALLLLVQRSDDDPVVLLLTGFLLSSLFISLGAFAVTLAQERWELGRAMVAFALGDVSGAGLRHIALAAPMVAGGVIAALYWSGPLDLMLSGEDEAAALGVDVSLTRKACVLWTAVLTAAAVSIGANVSFVGLVVPHGLRPLVGARHKHLIPAAALAGGLFLVVCDVLARALPTRAEVPLGVVTGLIGAPVFLTLLLRSRREMVGA